MYHPPTLRVEVAMPRKEELSTTMFSDGHAPLHRWPAMLVEEGRTVMELPLPPDVGGTYYLELATADQRTERRFTIRTA